MHLLLYKCFIIINISVETNSVNIRIIDCYTNYSNISEVFQYLVLSHALNVITRAQQTNQVQAMAKRFQSPVCEFFELVGEKSVKCNLCDPPGTVVRYHSGTTTMKNHLTSITQVNIWTQRRIKAPKARALLMIL